ncbi:MAG: hypothetical protein QGH60_17280 [Phycisphaerae bacterium]|jgi:hypothetical protein|nr:hypothetical protein [Phycisphaerae bacterium]
MARVVRRRKNPLLPPLLIFVFLFLIVCVGATLAYNKWKDAEKISKQRLTTLRKIISDRELTRDAGVKQIIDQYDKGRGKAPTVVGVLNGRIAELTRKITGSETTAASAVEQIESTVGKVAFVLNEVSEARAATAAEAGKVKDLESSLKTLAAEQQDAVAAYKALEEDFQTKAAALAEEKRALATANTDQATKHAADLKSNDATWQEKIAKQEQEVDTLAAKANKSAEKMQKLEVLVDILKRKLRDKKKTKELDLAVREAGRIKEIMSNRDVCFIPLGSRDRVVRGMTFRVYGPEGVPSDGEGHKAALTVIRVFKTVSQCRVSTVRTDDPVAIGDPFANIAFDPAHQPVFVVEGRFDISGTGRLTETGTQEVISLIKRSGGKIATKLTVDVDFVVMGPEPSKPAKLDEDAPGTTRKAHELRMEEYNRWRKTLDKAIALNVPKLNTRRFLTLTGYESVREYED